MDNKKLLYPLVVGAVIIIVVWYIAGLLGGSQYKPVGKTTVDTLWFQQDTVFVDKLIAAKKVPAKIDTVLIDNIPTEVAISDTVVAVDSSRIWARYYGTPYNFFDIYADIKERIITKTVYIKETTEVPLKEGFFSKFGLSLQAGGGYDIISRQPVIYIGAGVHFKLN